VIAVADDNFYIRIIIVRVNVCDYLSYHYYLFISNVLFKLFARLIHL